MYYKYEMEFEKRMCQLYSSFSSLTSSSPSYCFSFLSISKGALDQRVFISPRICLFYSRREQNCGIPAKQTPPVDNAPGPLKQVLQHREWIFYLIVIKTKATKEMETQNNRWISLPWPSVSDPVFALKPWQRPFSYGLRNQCHLVYK